MALPYETCILYSKNQHVFMFYFMVEYHSMSSKTIELVFGNHPQNKLLPALMFFFKSLQNGLSHKMLPFAGEKRHPKSFLTTELDKVVTWGSKRNCRKSLRYRPIIVRGGNKVLMYQNYNFRAPQVLFINAP